MLPHRTHQTTKGSSQLRGPRHQLAALLLASALVATSCGHTSSPGDTNPTRTTTPTTTTSADQAGVFGSLGKICEPGTPTKSDVRGVTGSTIRIGVLNDAGNTLSPGLGAAYPKVAKAFADWCNAAGGINGRKIVIVDRDAKLFNAASEVEDACQSDFMLVGGGAALDDKITAPREKCGLGAIPTLTPTYADQTGKLQAVIGRVSDQEANWGLFRLLDPEYHDALQKIGIVTLDTPSVRDAYTTFQKVLESKGMKVTTFQAVSQNFDNARTYIQPLVAKSDALIMAFPATQLFQAISDVGYQPKVVVDQGAAFYSNAAVSMLAQVPVKSPIYTAATTFPLDRASTNPTAKKLVALEKQAFGKADPANVVPWITWLLFAKSASACPELTVECVITKATADKAYTAGGLLAPIDMTDPTKPNQCFAVNTVSGDGIVYDAKLTAPTDGVFNCDPANLTPIP